MDYARKKPANVKAFETMRGAYNSGAETLSSILGQANRFFEREKEARRQVAYSYSSLESIVVENREGVSTYQEAFQSEVNSYVNQHFLEGRNKLQQFVNVELGKLALATKGMLAFGKYRNFVVKVNDAKQRYLNDFVAEKSKEYSASMMSDDDKSDVLDILFPKQSSTTPPEEPERRDPEPEKPEKETLSESEEESVSYNPPVGETAPEPATETPSYNPSPRVPNAGEPIIPVRPQESSLTIGGYLEQKRKQVKEEKRTGALDGVADAFDRILNRFNVYNVIKTAAVLTVVGTFGYVAYQNLTERMEAINQANAFTPEQLAAIQPPHESYNPPLDLSLHHPPLPDPFSLEPAHSLPALDSSLNLDYASPETADDSQRQALEDSAKKALDGMKTNSDSMYTRFRNLWGQGLLKQASSLEDQTWGQYTTGLEEQLNTKLITARGTGLSAEERKVFWDAATTLYHQGSNYHEFAGAHEVTPAAARIFSEGKILTEEALNKMTELYGWNGQGETIGKAVQELSIKPTMTDIGAAIFDRTAEYLTVHVPIGIKMGISDAITGVKSFASMFKHAFAV